MITIQTLTVTKPFRYLWLKSVVGVNLSVHCASCLKGEYYPGLNRHTKTANNIILDNGIYYLCGVSTPYNWYNNFHLAFSYEPGSNIHFSEKGISVDILDAKILPISEKFIDSTHRFANVKAYRTCRNWQFAHYYKQYL